MIIRICQINSKEQRYQILNQWVLPFTLTLPCQIQKERCLNLKRILMTRQRKLMKKKRNLKDPPIHSMVRRLVDSKFAASDNLSLDQNGLMQSVLFLLLVYLLWYNYLLLIPNFLCIWKRRKPMKGYLRKIEMLWLATKYGITIWSGSNCHTR